MITPTNNKPINGQPPKIQPDTAIQKHPVVTPEQKAERAQFLISTYEKYQKASPFYTSPGFLRSLAQKLMNFFRWVFRVNPPFPLSVIEMQFAMQLYRTCDANVMAQAGSRILYHFLTFCRVGRTS